MTDIWVPATASQAGAAWPLTVAATNAQVKADAWLDNSVPISGTVSLSTDVNGTLYTDVPNSGTVSLTTGLSAALNIQLPIAGTISLAANLSDVGFSANNVATLDLGGALSLTTDLAANLDQRTHLAGSASLTTDAGGSLIQRTHLTGSVSLTTGLSAGLSVRIDLFGSITLSLQIPDTQTAPFNDNFIDAIALSGDSGWIVGHDIHATTETGELDPTAGATSGSVWYRYDATTTGSLVVFTQGTGSTPNTDTVLSVWTGTTLTTLTEVVSNDDTSWSTTYGSQVQFDTLAGTSYWIRVGSWNEGAFQLGWSPQAPTLAAAAALRTPQYATLVVNLIGPADATTVPVLSPAFTITVTATSPTNAYLGTVTATVRYATDQAMTSPTTVSATATAATSTTLSVPVGTALVDGQTYWWQVQVTALGHTTGWSTARSFTVLAQPTNFGTGIPVTWTVDAAAIRSPHLWFVRPSAGFPGDTVTLIGHGVTNTTGTVTLAGIPAAITGWTRVAATGSTTGRIDPTSAVVDAEHYAITITVPDVPAPGGILTLEG